MAVVVPNEGAAGQFNADQAEIDSKDFEIISSGLAGVGVISGCAVTAQGSPDMTVAVAAGVVSIAGLSVTVAGGNVTITGNTSGDPRYDLIVVDNAGALTAVAGTTAANPVFPDIPANKVVLAAVYVNDTPGTITTGKIVDKRAILNVPSIVSFGADDLRVFRVAAAILGIDSGSGANVSSAIDLEVVSTISTSPATGYLRLMTKAIGGIGKFFSRDQNALTVGPFGDFVSQMAYLRGQYGGWSVPTSTTLNEGCWGILGAGVTLTSPAAVTYANGTEGRELEMPTAASTGSIAGFGSVAVIGRRNKQLALFTKFKHTGADNLRLFIGYTTATLAEACGEDHDGTLGITKYWMGLSACPAAHANYRWMKATNSATPTYVDTGIAIDTAVHYIGIRSGGTTIELELLSSAMANQHSSTSTSALPANTIDLALVFGIGTANGTAKSIWTYFGNVACQTV